MPCPPVSPRLALLGFLACIRATRFFASFLHGPKFCVLVRVDGLSHPLIDRPDSYGAHTYGADDVDLVGQRNGLSILESPASRLGSSPPPFFFVSIFPLLFYICPCLLLLLAELASLLFFLSRAFGIPETSNLF